MRRLLLRSLLAQRALVACVLLVLLATATGLAAWPRLAEAARGTVVSDAVARSSPLVRDVQGVTTLAAPTTDPATDPAAGAAAGTAPDNAPWDGVLSALEEGREAADEPLRGVLAPARVVLSTEPVPIQAPPGTDIAQAALGLGAGPELTAEADLVEGQWPTPGALRPRGARGAVAGAPGGDR